MTILKPFQKHLQRFHSLLFLHRKQRTPNANFIFKLFYFIFFYSFILGKLLPVEKHPSSSYKTVHIGKKQNNLSTFCTDVLYIGEVVQGVFKAEESRMEQSRCCRIHLEFAQCRFLTQTLGMLSHCSSG